MPETQAKRDVVRVPDVVETEQEIEAVLAWHDDNVRAAIGTLLNDIRHLRHQLVLTEGAASLGMTRGWRPIYDRD
ncbi:hypothetical protein ELG72_28035 (plasmid) [Rhizobium leguminosarum]|uniref:hypothetical protein n=1 Tax=Rhizobium leguminosarum TaxID=384 RepID=UPI001032477E|nr:hypothetical protein [Rhizobium leguminosarum]MBY5374601.1 hypothetical protein [Rhizobium leguminosarum]TBF25663.1 hypothetical protein ELG92_33045 [Rhizobium leguminosarum]TBF44616.1 hypothetical protein ELG91_32260 [Rhizobium leguminosarum]TBF47862.1 hypothetical protein ELG87_29310 [Rhizobium leguminosarum]TBF48498.1 hypothetical protein ELG90_29930 [Rhizobium leguminosarum]